MQSSWQLRTPPEPSPGRSSDPKPSRLCARLSKGEFEEHLVGLNPAPDSVTAGHYYQGWSGQRQLRRLVDCGSFTISPSERRFKRAAVRAGVGFSDLVKRPTAREGGVTAAELAFGRGVLGSELAARNVQLVICVFRQPAGALLGASDGAGYQSSRTSWGARVFRLPGQFEARERAHAVMKSLEVPSH